MSRAFLLFVAGLATTVVGCHGAPLSGRFPGGIPDDYLCERPGARGELARARLRDWLGPPPETAEDPTVRPPHSKFHPVPIRPVFGPDTSPIEPKFPRLSGHGTNLAAPQQESTGVPQGKSLDPQTKSPPDQPATQSKRPNQLKQPTKKAPVKETPAKQAANEPPAQAKQPRVYEASFEAAEKPASTLPRFRRLRR